MEDWGKHGWVIREAKKMERRGKGGTCSPSLRTLCAQIDGEVGVLSLS